MNQQWPARREYLLHDVFPPDHIRKYVELSLKNLDVPTIDLIQFHVWNDQWANDATWQRTLDDLKRQNLIRAAGLSINRWEPENGIATLETGNIDAVQVIYNIFDQAPEDRLLPVCRERDIAVIARVPFDEGTLTGTLTLESKWPEGDWRNTYFGPANLQQSVERAEKLRSALPKSITMPEAALRFILSNPDIATTIPGMRTLQHVESNISASDAGPLPAELMKELRGHRWDRRPAHWSD